MVRKEASENEAIDFFGSVYYAVVVVMDSFQLSNCFSVRLLHSLFSSTLLIFPIPSIFFSCLCCEAEGC